MNPTKPATTTENPITTKLFMFTNMPPAPLYDFGELVVVVMTGVEPVVEDEPEEEGSDGVVTAGDDEPEEEGDVGVAGLVVEPPAATTGTLSFMPPWQWPKVGHMKYIVPGVVRVMVVCPPL